MSIEDAKAKLDAARDVDRKGYNREMALGFRMEAAVLAIGALIERLPEPTRTCEHCGVEPSAMHTYHRSDCPDWRP